MDRLFIQFHGMGSGGYQGVDMVYNGFSATESLCRSIGDLLWIEQDYGKHIGRGIFEDDVDSAPLPIDRGRAYVSCHLGIHVYQAWLWAKQYPNIDFVTGGPSWMTTMVDGTLPDNFKVYIGSVESYFGVKDFSAEWGLTLPVEALDRKVLYCYSVDNYCNYGKCSFCNFHPYYMRCRKNPQWEFKNVRAPRQVIDFATPEFKPANISQFLELPYNDTFEYQVFVRATKADIKAFKWMLPRCPDPTKLHVAIGAEFPSRRMYKYMHKGSTVDEFVEMCQLVQSYRCNLRTMWITGWPNLQWDDLDELKEVLDKLHFEPEYNHIVKINKLHLIARMNSKELSNLPKHEPDKYGPFYHGSKPILSEESQRINRAAWDMITERVEDKTKFGPPNKMWRMKEGKVPRKGAQREDI